MWIDKLASPGPENESTLTVIGREVLLGVISVCVFFLILSMVNG